jgi:hypothetical protein
MLDRVDAQMREASQTKSGDVIRETSGLGVRISFSSAERAVERHLCRTPSHSRL